MTLSSQGGVYTTLSDIVISQSIGQSSVIGSSTSGNTTVFQGFQHKKWISLMRANKRAFDVDVFPNPFKDKITLTFLSESDASTEVSLYTISGTLMYKGIHYQEGLTLEVEFPNLPVAPYMLRVSQNNNTNYQQLIKI
ncbi:MAG: T9SS type A sorting domain-containing protein [Flavicella sp.]